MRVGKAFYLLTMSGHPFADRSVLTNSAQSYLPHPDFISKTANFHKVFQQIYKAHKTQNAQKLYRVHYNPRYRKDFTQMTEGKASLSGIRIITMFE